MFEQPFHDDDLIRRSGVAVQATILSHNTGIGMSVMIEKVDHVVGIFVRL